MNPLLNVARIVADEREMLRKSWGWFVALGLLFAALGVAGLVNAFTATVVTVLFVGWCFVIGGFAEAAHAVFRRGWSGFWLDLITGLFTGVAGVLIVQHPLAGASVLTVVIGVLFLVGGLFRIFAGVATRCPYPGWFVLHGIVSALLGGMILSDWPETSVWVIGTLVAVDLLIDGLRLVSFGFAVKNLPTVGGAEERATPPVA
jgi:uncharacterized membrane protein HdeD (DUF308 family)